MVLGHAVRPVKFHGERHARARSNPYSHGMEGQPDSAVGRDGGPAHAFTLCVANGTRVVLLQTKMRDAYCGGQVGTFLATPAVENRGDRAGRRWRCSLRGSTMPQVDGRPGLADRGIGIQSGLDAGRLAAETFWWSCSGPSNLYSISVMAAAAPKSC